MSSSDNGSNLICFDTETTGLVSYYESLIEISAVRFNLDGSVSEKFTSLLDPMKEVAQIITDITGLTNESLRDAPPFWDVLRDFANFIREDDILFAHNASFDISFMNVKLGTSIGERIINPVIDTALLTSALYYSLGDYSLESLAPRFNLDLKGRHNALCDARIAASLYLTLLPELKNRGVTTLPELVDFLTALDLTKGYPRTL